MLAPPVFVVAFLFIRDNKLAKGRGRCCWNYTAGVDEGSNKRGKDYWVLVEHGKCWLGMIIDLNILCIEGWKWRFWWKSSPSVSLDLVSSHNGAEKNPLNVNHFFLDFCVCFLDCVCVSTYSACLFHCLTLAFSCISVAVLFVAHWMNVAPFQLPAH